MESRDTLSGVMRTSRGDGGSEEKTYNHLNKIKNETLR